MWVIRVLDPIRFVFPDRGIQGTGKGPPIHRNTGYRLSKDFSESCRVSITESEKRMVQGDPRVGACSRRMKVSGVRVLTVHLPLH